MSNAGGKQLPGELQITIEDTDNDHQPARIVLHGELDMATAPRLREAIDTLLARPGATDVTIDLAELTFCDSTGLTEFIRADHELRNRGHQLRLRRPTSTVQHILALTHLDAALDVD